MERQQFADFNYQPVFCDRLLQCRTGAQFLGEAEHVGSLTPGKQADIMLVKGDPSAKIADIENVELVFKDGVGWDSKKLIDSVKGRYGQY